MNNVTQEQKDSVTKTLAIIGFVAAILFAVWLAVQIVSVIPSAFSSLASIADGVYNYNEDTELTVATKNSVNNTGEAFTITWSDMPRPGTYAFSYACTEGTALDARNTDGDIVALACDTELLLGTATAIDVVVTSEKQRFIDVPYTLVYIPNDETKNDIITKSKVTIVNASIPTSSSVAAEETETEVVADTDVDTTNNEVAEPVAEVATPAPQMVEEVVYEIPTSNPVGVIDLQITFLGVGTLTDKTFTRTSVIDRDEQGAFQFEVKNVGTKTAEDWTYEAKLPSGIEYDAGEQKPLKPNEKAVITLGFEGLSQLGVERFGVSIDAQGDINPANNSFTWAVEVVE